VKLSTPQNRQKGINAKKPKIALLKDLECLQPKEHKVIAKIIKMI